MTSASLALLAYFLSGLGVIILTFFHFRFNLRFGMKVKEILFQAIIALILIFTPWINTIVVCLVVGAFVGSGLWNLFQTDFFNREIKIGEPK